MGVVYADLGLAGGDLRAAERSFQLLHQVSGRAGRAERAGRALLQTWMPEHPVMQAMVSGDRNAFLAAEAEGRKARGLPPFGRLAALILSGRDQAETGAFARQLARHATSAPDLQVLGPAPAPLALLRGRYRFRFLIIASRQHDMQKRLRRWLSRVKLPPSLRLTIDIDPYSFM